MSARTIKLLHVEDNVADRLLTARLLSSMKEFVFTIVRAATEITAVAELNKGGVEFVILDYKLPMGDGLACLKKLRQMDPAVPIIVMSGVTTPEIGAACLQAGADDYLSKQDLTAEKLATSVRKALQRAGFWSTLRDQLKPICKVFMERLGNDLPTVFDDFEKLLRQASMNPQQLPSLFESVCSELETGKGRGAPSTFQLVRPLLLEFMERLTAPPPSPRPSSSSRPGG